MRAVSPELAQMTDHNAGSRLPLRLRPRRVAPTARVAIVPTLLWGALQGVSRSATALGEPPSLYA